MSNDQDQKDYFCKVMYYTLPACKKVLSGNISKN